MCSTLPHGERLQNDTRRSAAIQENARAWPRSSVKTLAFARITLYYYAAHEIAIMFTRVKGALAAICIVLARPHNSARSIRQARPVADPGRSDHGEEINCSYDGGLYGGLARNRNCRAARKDDQCGWKWFR